MSDYTVFAVDCDNEYLGDALLVTKKNLDATINALVEYWEARQELQGISSGVHCEVHDGSVRDDNGVKPLPGQPGQAVTDPDVA